MPHSRTQTFDNFEVAEQRPGYFPVLNHTIGETQSILGLIKPCLKKAAAGRSWAEDGREKGFFFFGPSNKVQSILGHTHTLPPCQNCGVN